MLTLGIDFHKLLVERDIQLAMGEYLCYDEVVNNGSIQSDDNALSRVFDKFHIVCLLYSF